MNSVNPAARLHYLKAMGIQQWVRRSLPVLDAEELPTETITPPSVNTTNLQTHLQSLRQGLRNNDKPTVIQKEIPAIVETNALNFIDREVQVLANLDWIALEHRVTACTACRLHQSRTQTVFGAGNQRADWLLIGEAPGADEDLQGEPFVGKAGQLLTQILTALQLPRTQVYIANVLKCRPPDNRNPAPDELACCTPFLDRQIALIQPKIIIALGAFAAQHLLNTNKPIGELRGKQHSYAKTGIPLIATYHPAYLLRSPSQKTKVWNDFQVACQIFANLQP